MKIFNFGSLNIDHVYAVEHFVQPGETVTSLDYRQFVGGKGLNQSVALAHAGADVVHVGRIGAEGLWLKERLEKSEADTSLIKIGKEPTGHAIIQVDQTGENSIIIHGGANQTLDKTDVEKILQISQPGDFVLTQNETSCVEHLLEKAAEKNLFTVFNPAPFTSRVNDYPLETVRMLIVNETEGAGITGHSEPAKILESLLGRFPNSKVVLTLGSKGVKFRDSGTDLSVPAETVKAIDTTGAGDTFIGYFLAEFMNGAKIESALRLACRASAICVQRKGAADSIPSRSELKN